MAKPINQTVGRCRCLSCDDSADVRRLKNHERGKLYLVCHECGTMRPSGVRFQRFVVNNTVLSDGHVFTDEEILMVSEKPEPTPEKLEPKPEPVTDPVPEPKPKTGFFSWLGSCFKEYNEWSDKHG